MASRQTVEFLIDGKVYRMTGYEEPDYINRMAAYINLRMEEFKKVENWRKLPADQRAVMIEMNLCDDLFKAKDLLEKKEAELALREKELYETKAQLAQLLADAADEGTGKTEDAEATAFGTQLSFGLEDA